VGGVDPVVEDATEIEHREKNDQEEREDQHELDERDSALVISETTSGFRACVCSQRSFEFPSVKSRVPPPGRESCSHREAGPRAFKRSVA
jgi:hypothetical protein